MNSQHGPSVQHSQPGPGQTRGRTLEKKVSNNFRTFSPPPCNCFHCKRKTCAIVWCLITLSVRVFMCAPFVNTILIENQQLNATLLDAAKKNIDLDWIKSMKNPTRDQNDSTFCYWLDYPAKTPAIIRLTFILTNVLGIIMFLVAAILPSGDFRVYLVHFYMFTLYAPLIGVWAVIYTKVEFCWDNYVYWVVVFTDFILNYGWITFGNEIAKAYNAWLEDPDEVLRRDLERTGKVGPEAGGEQGAGPRKPQPRSVMISDSRAPNVPKPVPTLHHPPQPQQGAKLTAPTNQSRPSQPQQQTVSAPPTRPSRQAPR